MRNSANWKVRKRYKSKFYAISSSVAKESVAHFTMYIRTDLVDTFNPYDKYIKNRIIRKKSRKYILLSVRFKQFIIFCSIMDYF